MRRLMRALEKERRDGGEFTQTEIAQLTGYSLTSVCSWMGGRGNPSIQCVVDVAQVMGLEIRFVRRKGDDE